MESEILDVEGQLQATLVPLCWSCDALTKPVVVPVAVVPVAEPGALAVAVGGMFPCQWGCVCTMFLRWECCHLVRCPCLVLETHHQDVSSDHVLQTHPCCHWTDCSNIHPFCLSVVMKQTLVQYPLNYLLTAESWNVYHVRNDCNCYYSFCQLPYLWPYL